MQKEIKDFTEVELKAICYDNLAQIEQCQSNIKLINQELVSRKNTQTPSTPVPTPYTKKNSEKTKE